MFGEEEPLKKLNKEITVDASLSNWLALSETTPVKNKANSLAIYIRFSASSSPRKSPCRSMDNEMPIIDNIGSYWNSDASAQDSSSATFFKGITHRTSLRRGGENTSDFGS
ncbi:hypothetical protein RJT34_16858 [Clitoria ternatea]|uniref:Uncharacterized protein n=1 Tax=Clitoria ternatea TaxID=43366 RepID=A0AAN9PCL4_CLITE